MISVAWAISIDGEIWINELMLVLVRISVVSNASSARVLLTFCGNCCWRDTGYLWRRSLARYQMFRGCLLISWCWLFVWPRIFVWFWLIDGITVVNATPVVVVLLYKTNIYVTKSERLLNNLETLKKIMSFDFL